MATLRNPKRRPTHPGALLREDVLPALDMSQTEFARRLFAQTRLGDTVVILKPAA